MVSTGFYHAYSLSVDLGQLAKNLRRELRHFDRPVVESQVLIPDIEVEALRRIGSGYKVRVHLDGVLQTTEPLGPEAIDQIKLAGQSYGVPLKVEYRGQQL